jgi:S-adenosyl-L-methionine hydrolase (adenosine-forming)
MKYLSVFVMVVLLLLSLSGCVADKASKPIVLLTDFGTDDYRVPRLKGVIYSANPDADVIDATHGIASVDIAAGAYVLGLTAAEFPKDVVFLAAVGAGSTPDEKTLVVVNNKDQIFVLPDNGLITFVAANLGIKKAYAVTNADLFDKPMAELSSHQILGKVAAVIAGGYKIEKVGAAMESPVLLDIQKASISNGVLTGYVVFVDHYGSCLTNITKADAASFNLKPGDAIKISVNGKQVSSVIGTRYGDVAVGKYISMVNSMEILQLSINKGSFATENGVKTGVKVEISRP